MFFTSLTFIPTIIFSMRLYRRFEAKNLKKKFRMLMTRIIELLTITYGTVWFNTNIDPLPRAF